MFETICFIIYGIVGLYCFSAPPEYVPPGDCVLFMCIVSEPTEMPIRASWYNPALGGINCMEPCDRLGDDSLLEDDLYGHVIACPLVGMVHLSISQNYDN